jgi:hypothetical protein
MVGIIIPQAGKSILYKIPRPILQRLGQVQGADGFRAGQVGDGARQLGNEPGLAPEVIVPNYLRLSLLQELPDRLWPSPYSRIWHLLNFC